jgi:type VI secretion system protein ImpH
MAGSEREPGAGVTPAAPDKWNERLGFLPLVSLLEKVASRASPVGTNASPRDEAIRFRHDPSMVFAARDVSRVVRRGTQENPKFDVTTTFLGLFGAVSPLPSYLIETILFENEEDGIRRQFLDLFHHRLISLLYRSLQSTSVSASQNTAMDDDWSTRMLALCGVDAGLDGQTGVLTREELLSLAPLLALPTRSALSLTMALTRILRRHLGGPEPRDPSIRVHEFAGAWVPMGQTQQWRLGQTNSNLARQTVLGSKSYDPVSGFAIHVGPVSQEVYQQFLPGGALREKAASVVDLFVRDPLSYRYVVELSSPDLEPLRLSVKGSRRLGRDAWLGRSKSQKVMVVDGSSAVRSGGVWNSDQKTGASDVG